MGAPARVLPSLLLGLLLASSPGAPGANPGLVARITDQGLQYGKERWLRAGLADPLGTRLSWVRRCTDRTLFLRPGGLPGQAALARTLASSPTQPLSRSGTYFS